MSEIRNIFDALIDEEGIEASDTSLIPDFSKYVVTRGGDIFYLHPTSEELRQVSVSNSGFPYVNMVHDDGKRRNRSLPRIVASAFIPNPHDVKYVIHKNMNSYDNRVSNLQWSNQKYRRNSPTVPEKLSEDNVLQIYHKLLDNHSVRSLSSEYNVSYQSIQKIKSGRMFFRFLGRDKICFLNRIVCSGIFDDIVEHIKLRDHESLLHRVPEEFFAGSGFRQPVLIGQAYNIYVVKEPSSYFVNSLGLGEDCVQIIKFKMPKTSNVLSFMGVKMSQSDLDQIMRESKTKKYL